MRYYLWLVLFWAANPLPADEPSVAKMRTPVGTVVQRTDKGWLAPMLYDALPARTQLVTFAGARGIMEFKEGDIRLVMAGNLPEPASAPVFESTITILPATGARDLEFSLERGRVIIENHKEAGAVKVRANIYGKSLDFDLLENKSNVALELSSRWPVGSPFLKEPTSNHKPERDLSFIVAGGKVTVELNNELQTLQGPVLYRFNTVQGSRGPLGLKVLPAWIKPTAEQPASVKTLQTAGEKLRRAIADHGVVGGLAMARADADQQQRALAAYDGVALDQPAAGIIALEDQAKEVRRAGAVALRHFCGRGSAEDLRVYESLLEQKIKAGPAGIIMDLLHGLGDDASARPETYETLITYLGNDSLPIRELAAQTLVDLVPRGKDIAFDAAGSVQELGRAQTAWRKLIPAGKLP